MLQILLIFTNIHTQIEKTFDKFCNKFANIKWLEKKLLQFNMIYNWQIDQNSLLQASQNKYLFSQNITNNVLYTC